MIIEQINNRFVLKIGALEFKVLSNVLPIASSEIRSNVLKEIYLKQPEIVANVSDLQFITQKLLNNHLQFRRLQKTTLDTMTGQLSGALQIHQLTSGNLTDHQFSAQLADFLETNNIENHEK